MELSQIFDLIKGKNFQPAIRPLEELLKLESPIQSDSLALPSETENLEKKRRENLPKLKTQVNKLLAAISRCEDETIVEPFRQWVESYQQSLKNCEEQLKKVLGSELEEELKKIGLPLSGQYPELKASFFLIELIWEKGTAILWYGYKQERLEQCDLSVKTIVESLIKIKTQLGSSLSPGEYLNRLQKAYHRAAGAVDVPVPICDILCEMSFLLQNQQFRCDPIKKNYKSYGRADFSFDLFRLRRSEEPLLQKLHMTVATRTHSRTRRDFIWIPDDDNGQGTIYSHLQFKETI
jgi:hypothetical protein